MRSPELVEGDQLLLEGVDEPRDRLAGLGQSGVDALALHDGHRVGGAVLGEPVVDLGTDQGRVGEQARGPDGCTVTQAIE